MARAAGKTETTDFNGLRMRVIHISTTASKDTDRAGKRPEVRVRILF